MPTIRIISATDTHALRLAVLRPGQPPDTVLWPGDGDPTTTHFGAFLSISSAPVGIATLLQSLPPADAHPHFTSHPRWPHSLPLDPAHLRAFQLRGMATDPAHRGQGLGLALLHATIAHARAHTPPGTPCLYWCNARTSALPFYEAQGLWTLGPTFDLPIAGPHQRMALLLP